MAFVRINWQKITSSINDAEPRGWSYSTTTDNEAAVETTGYFNDVFNEITSKDYVYARMSDVTRFYEMTKSGSDVVLSQTNLVKNSYSLIYTTNAGGTQEDFFMTIAPTLDIELGTILALEAVTGDTVLTFELRGFDQQGSEQLLGTVAFSANAQVPLRKNIAVSPVFRLGEFVSVWFQKVNTGTAQAVPFIFTLWGTSP